MLLGQGSGWTKTWDVSVTSSVHRDARTRLSALRQVETHFHAMLDQGMPQNPTTPPRQAWERLRPVLRAVPLFSGLDDSLLERLAAGARMLRVAPGAVVVERGEAAQSLFAVATGRLKVVAPRDNGRLTTLHILGPGDVFGEIAVLQSGGRTARVAALQESVVVTLDRRDFLELVRTEPQLSQRLLALMAQRLRQTIERLDERTSLGVAQRLARRLLVLAEHLGERKGENVRLGIRLSQRELAELVDTTRQSINLEMRRLGEAGLLFQQEGHIVLTDLERLQGLAQGTCQQVV